MAHIKNSEAGCGFCGGTGTVNGAKCTCSQGREEKAASNVSEKKMGQRANADPGARASS